MSKNPKNWQKLLKLKKISISSECHDEFQRNAQENVTYDNLKSHKKSGLHPLSRKQNFGKNKLVVSNWPPAFLGVKITFQHR